MKEKKEKHLYFSEEKASTAHSNAESCKTSDIPYTFLYFLILHQKCATIPKSLAGQDGSSKYRFIVDEELCMPNFSDC